ncbi:MAG: RHS repeat-associated core domain-containing protein, partial [Nitrospira sp.]|nr:RHS repeat-associated core domain-containing protein [Nitrospira sp.]
MTTSTYDNAGGLAKQTQTEAVSYDAYGNLTLSYNRGDFTGNNAITSDDTTTAVTYAPADTTNWVIGFPTVQRTYAGLGTGGTKLSETLTSYDGTGSCTTPAGSATTVTKGHVTKVERWLNGGANPISGMEYDSTTGALLCTRDPKGNKTTLTYDSTKTFPLTSTNALGHVTTRSYYGVNGVASDTGVYGQLKSITDPNSRTSTNTYDALGRRFTTTASDGFINTMAYNYGAGFSVGTQHVQSTTSGGGLSVNLVSKTYFDGLGRTIKTESPGAADGGGALKVLVTETQYDVRGLVKQTSLPYFQGTETATGRWRTMTYDALGRLTKSTNPDNTSSQVCYNGWTTTSLDPKLHKKVETKDAFGRLVTVQEYTGTGSVTDCSGGTLYATTSYSYDRLGDLLGVTDAKGNVSSMTYDTLGRKLTMHDPDMGNWSYTYDANGNLLTQVDAKNQKLCFSYDALNRRTQKNYGTTTVACGTNTVVYAYDDTVTANNGKGRLKQVSDPAQSVTFQYDSRGRITQSVKTLDGTTYTTTSAYDGLGRLTSVSYPTSPIKTVTYIYDGPQLKSVQEGATNYVTYAGWNALGQPATSTFGNGVVTTNTYANTANATCPQQTFRLCTLKTQKGATPFYQDLRYDYEANGNVGNIYDNTVAASAGDQHFAYDDLDRLTLANGPYGASGINATLPYSYDQIGNMTVNPQVGAYSYPASGPSSVRPHAVSVAGPYPISYDNNGNIMTMTDPTGFFGYNASYNTDNRLSSITTTYGGVPTTATFVYDGDGGRVKKIDGATTTRYISTLYECDTTGGATSCSRYIWAGSKRIATIASNGATHYWHGDHLGSSSVITDATGAKVQALAYFPYGDMRTNQSFTTPAINVPYKYTGKELDASSNLYFYEARYYHAVFGRFVSPDTIVPYPRDPQNLNRYSYVRNNPLRYTDPTGHEMENNSVVGSGHEAWTELFQWQIEETLTSYANPSSQGVESYVIPDIT